MTQFGGEQSDSVSLSVDVRWLRRSSSECEVKIKQTWTETCDVTQPESKCCGVCAGLSHRAETRSSFKIKKKKFFFLWRDKCLKVINYDFCTETKEETLLSITFSFSLYFTFRYTCYIRLQINLSSIILKTWNSATNHSYDCFHSFTFTKSVCIMFYVVQCNMG